MNKSHINTYSPVLKASQLDTPLGPMTAIANEEALYLLEFTETPSERLKRGMDRLTSQMGATIVPGHTSVSRCIEKELQAYFNGELQTFQTPLFLFGSPFQRRVWEKLRKIPYGQTLSYAQQAVAIGQPTACRAVANANGANHLGLVIPCHRVINASGALGGYGGGIARKKWLLNHEKQ